MAPISREQAPNNALVSARMEGLPVTEQTRRDCQRLLDGQIDARALATEIIARCKAPAD